MKRFIVSLVFVLAAFALFSQNVCAQENPIEAQAQQAIDNMENALGDEARKALEKIGADSADPEKLLNLKAENILGALLDTVKENIQAPLKAFAAIAGTLIIFSLLDTVRGGLSAPSMQSVIQTALVLSVSLVLVPPVTELIGRTADVISASSKFMLAYIPAITGVMAASGDIISSASYYGLMVFACQGIVQLCSGVIAPLLNIFFGLSISGAVCPFFNLGGICKTVSKVLKWVLGFAMTVFSATLTIKTMITAVADSVSTRAVRFSLSSFVPIVGSSLSEAYKTVQSSMQLLKSGIGVFAIIAVIAVFLPPLINALMWAFFTNLSKGVCEMLLLKAPCAVLEASSSVISVSIVMMLCTVTVFVISTAVLLMAGGA